MVVGEDYCNVFCFFCLIENVLVTYILGIISGMSFIAISGISGISYQVLSHATLILIARHTIGKTSGMYVF